MKIDISNHTAPCTKKGCGICDYFSKLFLSFEQSNKSNKQNNMKDQTREAIAEMAKQLILNEYENNEETLINSLLDILSTVTITYDIHFISGTVATKKLPE